MSSQLDLALAACRSIRFATAQAARHGGDYSLNDLLAADKLAREALAAPTSDKVATHQPLASESMDRAIRLKHENRIRAEMPFATGLVLSWCAQEQMFIAMLPKRSGSWSRGGISCTIKPHEAVKLELFIAEKTAPIIKAFARTIKKGGRK